jgi:uncharacterized membrane protein
MAVRCVGYIQRARFVIRRAPPSHGGAVAVKAHLLEYWERLRSSFWFVPGILAGAAVVLASVAVALDESVTVGEWMAGKS